MGTTIDGIGVASAGRRHRKSALWLADASARRAVGDAGLAPDDIDMLINCGLYRDRNLSEPALAALVQEDVGSNPEDPHPGSHGTFSFDVANGTSGPLNGLQIIDRFARANTIQHGLVVTSDADPGHRLSAAFPFTPAGGAVVCGWADNDLGLGEMHWESFAEDTASFRSSIGQRDGRNLLEIEIDDLYYERAGAAAAKVVARVLDDASLRVDDLTTVVLAPGQHALARAFADRSTISSERVTVAGDERLHTASFIVALDKARSAGLLEPGSTVLFVCVSAGITAGACVYRV
jgi:3-oxoacyl-[acyl-carrier-protein] synthase-3